MSYVKIECINCTIKHSVSDERLKEIEAFIANNAPNSVRVEDYGTRKNAVVGFNKKNRGGFLHAWQMVPGRTCSGSTPVSSDCVCGFMRKLHDMANHTEKKEDPLKEHSATRARNADLMTRTALSTEY